MPALVTDSGCVTLFLAVNTLEYLKDNGGLESEDRWLPDEWGYSDENDSELSKLLGVIIAVGIIFSCTACSGSDSFADNLND